MKPEVSIVASTNKRIAGELSARRKYVWKCVVEGPQSIISWDVSVQYCE